MGEDQDGGATSSEINHPPTFVSPVGECVAMAGDRILIPNECEGSKISPCGRNDREVNGDDVFNITTQSLEGEEFREVPAITDFQTYP